MQGSARSGKAKSLNDETINRTQFLNTTQPLEMTLATKSDKAPYKTQSLALALTLALEAGPSLILFLQIQGN